MDREYFDQLFCSLQRIEGSLQRQEILLSRLLNTEADMATSEAQLLTALQAEQLVITNGQAAVVSAMTLVTNDVTEILNKLAAGTQPEDLTDELTIVQSNMAAITAGINGAQTFATGVDQQVNPPPPPSDSNIGAGTTQTQAQARNQGGS